MQGKTAGVQLKKMGGRGTMKLQRQQLEKMKLEIKWIEGKKEMGERRIKMQIG